MTGAFPRRLSANQKLGDFFQRQADLSQGLGSSAGRLGDRLIGREPTELQPQARV
jgi:hypothetical protein